MGLVLFNNIRALTRSENSIKTLKSVIARVSSAARAFASILRFAACSEHPKSAAIAAAYLRLRLRLILPGRPPQCITLLGTEFHFTDAPTFAFLLRELFIEDTYQGCEQPPATVVDCGCHIGMSILLFKNLWPDASITGIEASPETFALLKQNVKDRPGVTVINKAISDRHGVIPLYSGYNSVLASANSLRGGGKPNSVEAAPLSEFITGSVDLLKVDIEGSEEDAFAELEASGKMPLISQMFIEYHHHLVGEAHRLSTFLDRLERCGFDYELAAALPKRYGGFQDVLIRAKRKA